MPLLAILVLAASAAAPLPAAPIWGVGLGVNMRQPIWRADPEGVVAEIARAGFRWIRVDMTWEAIERRPGRYDFSWFDPLMRAAARHGVRVVGILCYGNGLYETRRDDRGRLWAPAGGEYRAAFARYGAALAARYKGRGHLWEVWNEPSHWFWGPKPNPEHYVGLVAATRAEIARDAPGEKVVGPGVTPNNPEFLSQALQFGMADLLDALTVHPYRQDGPEGAAVRLYEYRRALQTASPTRRVPVSVTEWGYSQDWAASGGKLGRERQGERVVRAALVAFVNGAEQTLLFDWRAYSTNTASPEAPYGLTEANGRWLPAMEGLDALNRNLKGYRFLARIPQGNPRTSLIAFRKGSDLRFVAWRDGEEAAASRLPAPLRRFGRTDLIDGITELDPATARGFDPAEPRVVAASEQASLLTPRETDPSLSALARTPALPTTLDVWDEASGRIAMREVLDGLAASGRLRSWSVSEVIPESGRLTLLREAGPEELAVSRIGEIADLLGRKVSKDGFRSLRISARYADGAATERETLLR